jgi:hypothetical protein
MKYNMVAVFFPPELRAVTEPEQQILFSYRTEFSLLYYDFKVKVKVNFTL